MLYAEQLRDLCGVFFALCPERNLLPHGRHEKLVIRILVNNAHLFIPRLVSFRLLFEFLVYVLRNIAARGFIQPRDQAQERCLSAAVFAEKDRSAER